MNFFLKQTEKECIEKYKSLSKDQFNEKMKEMDDYFQIFKTKIVENEIFHGTSSEIEIQKINKTKFTRFYLTLLSVDKYRKERTEEMKTCKRFMKAKDASTNEIGTAGLMIENQIERFSIIKEEKLIRKKMIEGREIIPIESLGKLPDIEFMNKDYLMLRNKYEFNLQNQEQFMNEFLQYIEFHEDALNLYKSETNDIFIQTALKITKQHKRK